LQDNCGNTTYGQLQKGNDKPASPQKPLRIVQMLYSKSHFWQLQVVFYDSTSVNERIYSSGACTFLCFSESDKLSERLRGNGYKRHVVA
jgi:hypothetical protein